jgi:hypothetical protein
MRTAASSRSMPIVRDQLTTAHSPIQTMATTRMSWMMLSQFQHGDCHAGRQTRS